MSSRVRDIKKKSRQSSSSSSAMNDDREVFAVLRNQVNEKLFMVRRSEIISTKVVSKLVVGDIVSHGTRDKRVRAVILLIGKIR
jgi:hypothetical protein